MTTITLVAVLAIAQQAPANTSTQGTLALASKYIQLYEKKLEPANQTVVRDVDGVLKRSKALGAKPYREAVNDLVTHLTTSAGKMNSPSTMLVVSGKLATAMPNQRTFNLFASVLSAIGKDNEAVVPLQAAIAMPTLFPAKDPTIELNLAVAYLDSKQPTKAKAILDKVLKADPTNRRAWRTYAAYWFEKKNDAKVYECLMKGSQFAGFVKRKIEKSLLDVIDNEVNQAEPVESIERKLANLDKVLPVTTAVVIEEIEPKIATELKSKRLALKPDEKAKLPELPSKYVNTTSLRTFTEQSPALLAWMEAFGDEYKEFLLSKPGARDVVNAGSAGQQQQEADALARKEMEKALQDAKEQIERAKAMNLPGASTAALEQALRELEKQAAAQGITLKPKDPAVPGGLPPDFDYGSRFVRINYANYVVIRQAYEAYFFRYFLQDYPLKESVISQAYGQKIAPVVQDYARRKMAHESAADHVIESIEIPNRDPVSDCRKCIQMRMEHRREANSLAEDHWKQWANLYFPAYAQKMKPMLERYWQTSMLYIRNMSQKDVMEREYARVQETFYRYGTQAATALGRGFTFVYEPISYEEEMVFEASKHSYEEIAETEVKPQTLRQFDVPKDDWVKWIGDNLHFEGGLSVPLVAHLKLKITPTTVEFEPYAAGMLASIKLDMLNGKLDTTWGPSIKMWFPGIRMLGLEGEVQLDAFRKQTSIGLEDGSYSESFLKPGGAVQLKNSLATAKLQMDIELKSKLEVKMTPKIGKVTFGGPARDVIKWMD